MRWQRRRRAVVAPVSSSDDCVIVLSYLDGICVIKRVAGSDRSSPVGRERNLRDLLTAVRFGYCRIAHDALYICSYASFAFLSSFAAHALSASRES